MTQVDLKDIALLWQEEPTAEEQREFRGFADKTERRAQFLQFAELGLGLLLIVAVLVAIFVAPGPATLVVGALSITAIAWSSWKRHLLSQVAMLVETSDRHTLVGHALVLAKARLRRSTLGLWFLLPGVLSGAFFTHILDGGALAVFPKAVVERSVTLPEGPIVLFILLVVTAQMLRTNLRLGTEVARLEGLSEDYLAEARLDAKTLD